MRRRFQIRRIPVRFVAEGAEGLGHLKNISKAGLFIRSEEVPRTGASLAIQFDAPDGKLINLRGQVRWRTLDLLSPNVPPGFGVQLHEPPQSYREFFLWAAEQAEKEEDGKEAV